MVKLNTYVVSYEYSDGTIYAKEISAKTKEDASKFIESVIKSSQTVKVQTKEEFENQEGAVL